MKRKKTICYRINHFAEKHFKIFLVFFGIFIGLVLVLGFINVGFIVHRGYSLERAVEKHIKADKSIELLRTERFDDDKGIAFVTYGCEKRMFRIRSRCQGEAYFFVDLIDEKWVINKSSSRIIWENE